MKKHLLLSILTSATLLLGGGNAFADGSSATAGANSGSDASASAGASAVGIGSSTGIGVGYGGGGGGGGSASSGLNQQNALSTQAGAMGNSTVVTFEGTTIPTHTTATIEGTQTLKNVPAVYAPSLTTTLTETCMGSTSGGLAVAGFGISGGGTWVDVECVNRLNARDVKALQVPGAALASKEVLCANAVVRQAFKKTGHPCMDDMPNAQKTSAVDPSGVASQSAPFTYTDPIVRKRLGLPPL